MAKACIPKIDDVTGNIDGTFNMNMSIVFSGSDVPNGTDLSPISTIIDGAATPIDIKNILSDAVMNEAIRIGYSLVKSDIIIPNFQKGN